MDLSFWCSAQRRPGALRVTGQTEPLFRRTSILPFSLRQFGHQTGHCPGLPPQDPQYYPRKIFMQPRKVANDGTVESFQSIEHWGQVEYINDVEGLCDQAGCQCVGPVIDCNKVESHFFEPAMAAEYAELYFHTCECLAVPETENVTNATNQIDLGEGRVVILPESLQNQTTRLNPDGAVQPETCLAGEVAGWTFKGLADHACCSGYSFNVMSAQEAFMLMAFRTLVISSLISLPSVSICPCQALRSLADKCWMTYKYLKSVHKEMSWRKLETKRE